MEVLQKISDALLKDCPVCGKTSLKKKVSAVAFRLKGSGWYETDFKTGDKKNLAGDAKPDKGSDASGGAGESASGKASGKQEKSSSSAPDNKTASSGQNKSTA